MSDDLDYPCLCSVTLMGRVKKRWDNDNDRAPLKLVVETYKTLQDGRKIGRSDVVALWGDFLKKIAASAQEGALVSVTARIDSSKDKDGNWRDELRAETIQVFGGKRAPAQPDPRATGYSADDSIPFAPPGLF